MVEYQCSCGYWSQMIQVSWNQSSSLGPENATYKCPACEKKYHTHGADPAYNVSSSHLSDILPWREVVFTRQPLPESLPAISQEEGEYEEEGD